jgi:hypothetical protein
LGGIRSARTSYFVVRTFTFLVLSLFAIPVAAADHYGRVSFGGVPVPGASVAATTAAVAAGMDTSGDGVPLVVYNVPYRRGRRLGAGRFHRSRLLAARSQGASFHAHALELDESIFHYSPPANRDLALD